jgi:hypothetical protein
MLILYNLNLIVQKFQIFLNSIPQNGFNPSTWVLVRCQWLALEQWFSTGTPALEQWFSTGTPALEQWFSTGTPALEQWFSTGTPALEQWFSTGTPETGYI